MSNSISNLTNAIDTIGTEEYLEELRLQVIVEAQNKLEESINRMTQIVDYGWSGGSKDVFLNNYRTEVNAAKTSLDEAMKQVENVFGQLGESWQDNERNLIDIAGSL